MINFIYKTVVFMLVSLAAMQVSAQESAGRYGIEKASVVYIDHGDHSLSLSFVDYGSKIRLELGNSGVVIITNEKSIYMDTYSKTYYTLDNVTADSYLSMFNCTASEVGFYTPQSDSYYNLDMSRDVIAGKECVVWHWIDSSDSSECQYGGWVFCLLKNMLEVSL